MRYRMLPLWIVAIHIAAALGLACQGCGEPDYTYDAHGAQKCVQTCSAAQMEVTAWHPNVLGTEGCCHCGRRVHP